MNLGVHVCDKHLWRMCEVRTRVSLALARVCVQDMTCAHVKYNEKTKIHVYYPPVIVRCSYAFVCNHCIRI